MRVREVMTRDVRVSQTDETIRGAARMMAEIVAGVISVAGDDRLVGMLTDRDKRLVGILSLGDLAVADRNGSAGEALAAISRPGGQHSQAGDMRH